MRVSCHVFGSPRVGGEEWRQAVHSVPNLRIYRAENGSDPYVMLPNGNEWVHCGHAIQICDLTGHRVAVSIRHVDLMAASHQLPMVAIYSGMSKRCLRILPRDHHRVKLIMRFFPTLRSLKDRVISG